MKTTLALVLFVLASTPVHAQSLRELSNRPDPQALTREQIEARERAREQRERADQRDLDNATWAFVSAASADWAVTSICSKLVCNDRSSYGFLYGVENPHAGIPLGLAADALFVYLVREYVFPDHPKLARSLFYVGAGVRVVFVSAKVFDLREHGVRVRP